jgi:hypothetical protein
MGRGGELARVHCLFGGVFGESVFFVMVFCGDVAVFLW